MKMPQNLEQFVTRELTELTVYRNPNSNLNERKQNLI